MNGRDRIGTHPRDRLLPAADRLPPWRRSLLLEMLTRVVYPSVLVVAVFLFLVGTHRPGGGFAAGLVAGVGLVLRRVAGGPRELETVTPAPPGALLGAGLVVLAGYGVAGLLLAGEPWRGARWRPDLGPLGSLEVPGALVFEVGVVLVVVGLVVDLLRALGEPDRAGVDRADREEAP